jgi:hypothetical protein
MQSDHVIISGASVFRFGRERVLAGLIKEIYGVITMAEIKLAPCLNFHPVEFYKFSPT